MEHISSNLKIPSHIVRQKNFYKNGEFTHYGQLIDDCHIQRLWSSLLQSSDYLSRQKHIEEYNSQNRWKKKGIGMVPVKFGMSFTARFMNQGGACPCLYRWDGDGITWRY